MATISELGTRVLRRLGVEVVATADRPALFVTIPVAEIARQALQWLAVVADDDVPNSNDLALARAKVAALHDGLVAQGIVSWAADAIPQSVVEDYVILTALHLAPAFGKTGDVAQEPVREARIRKVAMLMRSQALAEQAVYAIHVDLAARGKVRWSSEDIPVFVEDPYVDLAAAQLAFAFGVQVPPEREAMARLNLSRLISLPSSGERVVADYF